MPYVLIIDSKVKISDKIFGPSKYERTFIYQILPIRLSWATVNDTVYHIQMGYFYSVFLLTCLRPGFFFNFNAEKYMENIYRNLKAIWNLQNKGNHWHSRRQFFFGSNLWALGVGAVFISWILNGQLHWTVFLLYI